MTKDKFDETTWKQQAQSLFGQELFDYLDNNPSADNLVKVAVELDLFRDLLDLDFLRKRWHELSSRHDHMANDLTHITWMFHYQRSLFEKLTSERYAWERPIIYDPYEPR